MKKHLTLGLCLLLSTAAQARSHNRIKHAIKACQRATIRGASNMHLAAIVSALQDAHADIKDALDILNAVKEDMLEMSSRLDARVADLSEQIDALDAIAGDEESLHDDLSTNDTDADDDSYGLDDESTENTSANASAAQIAPVTAAPTPLVDSTVLAAAAPVQPAVPATLQPVDADELDHDQN